MADTKEEKPPEKKEEEKSPEKIEETGCKIIFCCLTFNWYIVLPLLVLGVAYVAISVQNILTQSLIIKNFQCPIVARELCRVQNGVLMIDTDGDGIPDHLDEDDDNDGILDENDSDMNNDGILNSDIDNNGIPDHLDAQTYAQVSKNQSILDIDTDGDGIPDLEDDDDDNDGIPDSEDDDDNGDGKIDVDSDNDGLFDFLDSDDDNDGIPDYLESAWSMWSKFTECSVTCGTGVHTRKRRCQLPSGRSASDCEGEDSETAECTGQRPNCAVDGGWTSWSSWSDCSVSCGNGGRKKTRTCSQPEPKYGGKECKGGDEQTTTCAKKACVGKWQNWNGWQSCKSEPCEYGTRTRSRKCKPRNCQGNSKETKRCNKACPEYWFNQFFRSADHGDDYSMHRTRRYAFVYSYFKIPFDAKVNKIYFYSYSKEIKFYLSFWQAIPHFKDEKYEIFRLRKKILITPYRLGQNEKTLDHCIYGGTYLGTHYRGHEWDKNLLATVGHGHKYMSNHYCKAYYDSDYDKANDKWKIGDQKAFKKANDMFCPFVLLRVKCTDCNQVILNKMFYLSDYTGTLENFKTDSSSYDKLTRVFMHMKFKRDGEIRGLKYRAMLAKKRILLHFYEAEVNDDQYPESKTFILKKIRTITTQKEGINILNIKYTFKAGWYLGTSYENLPSKNAPSYHPKAAVIGYKAMPSSASSFYHAYYTDKFGIKLGTKIRMKRTHNKRVLAIIAKIKYKCT